MAADGDHGSGGAIGPEDLQGLAAHRPDEGAGLDDVGQDAVQVEAELGAQALQQGPRPGAQPRIDQAGGRCVGDLGDPLAGEEAGQEIGQEQQGAGVGAVRGPGDAVVARLGHELEHRVELLHLQAVDRVDLRRRDLGEDPLGDAAGALGAVGVDLRGQGARAVDQAVVHAPGVDADRRQGADVAHGREQALAHLVPQVEHVPEQALALTGGQGDGAVGEAARLGQVDASIGDGADHDAPGGGAEVDGADVDGAGGGHEGSFRRTSSDADGGGASTSRAPRRAPGAGCTRGRASGPQPGHGTV